MIIGVTKETYPGERRVALVPAGAAALAKDGFEVFLEPGAGETAGYPDAAYAEKGARLTLRPDVFAKADVLLMVRAAGANPQRGREDLPLFRSGQAVVGFMNPLAEPAAVKELAAKGATLFALELVPRVTRAQSMDALSSMATVAGYRAVLLAAQHLPKFFPMFMTAAGTVTAARVLVIGAGVAGLQAIATARRLGALVQAYDVRPAVKEQVESLGAKFVELPLETQASEDKGGYAKALGEDFYRRQRELMGRVVAACDVVICTAAVPGKKAPVLVTGDMVGNMAPGSVVVDLAAESGGNCELTRPGETVTDKGVTVLGPVNVPASLPYHASQMYSKNITNLVRHVYSGKDKQADFTDEITRSCCLTLPGEAKA